MMCQLRYARWCCEAGVRAQLRIVVAPAGAWRNVAIWQRLLLRGLGRRDMGQQNKARTRWRFLIRVNDPIPETSIMPDIRMT